MTSTPDENTEIKRGAVSNFVRQSLMGGLLIVLPDGLRLYFSADHHLCGYRFSQVAR
jgi:hypothetical protein